MLADGAYPVPKGRVATIVTYLDMRAPVPPRPCAAPENAVIRSVTEPDSTWYRDLFYRVGGQDWLWFSRLKMPVSELQTILNDPKVQIYALEVDGIDEGLLELDFRTPDTCEISFFGVTSRMQGTTAGRFLMNAALSHAWAEPISRLFLHTCTLDHPRALAFYQRTGFVATHQEVELAPDPRIVGDLPENAGPHIPIFR